MYEPGLVNIITPSYNSAHMIPRLLDSVLKQTYPLISMFVIDDGSTDNTREVINKYIPLFEQKGYLLRYIYQSNGGQSAAINNGLKLVTGEYLAWPDSDDWYKTDDAIITMVNMLQNSGDEVGSVRGQMEYISEDTMEVERTTSITPCNSPCKLLNESICQTNEFYYAPIGWMVKVRLLDDFIPNREIFVRKNSGQNAQIMWPFFASSKSVTSERVLASYLVRKTSHSRERKDYIRQLEYYSDQLKCNVSVIESLPLSDQLREKYIRIRQEYYYKAYLDLDYRNNGTQYFRKHYQECVKMKLPIDERFRRLHMLTSVFSIKTYKILARVYHKFRGR